MPWKSISEEKKALIKRGESLPKKRKKWKTYIIEYRTKNGGNLKPRICKIGVTSQPLKTRLKQFQLSWPFEIKIHLVLDSFAEGNLHKQFDSSRIGKTEWFVLSDEILEFIEKNKKGNITITKN